MIELAVEDVSIIMEHVGTCCCKYVADPITTNDVKLIDTRCISAYAVPDAVSKNNE